LIEQRNFQRGCPARARSCERSAVESIGERLGPEFPERRVCCQTARAQEIHDAKASRVVEDHRCARRKVKHDVIVPVGLSGHVVRDSE
jgi:hypothetical protein